MIEPKQEELNSQFSPLNPPDAYHPPSSENIKLEELHIFREDTIVFPLAHKSLDSRELDRLLIELC